MNWQRFRAEIIAFCRKAGKELLLSGVRGCLCGAGVGFFLLLRLGFPKDAELAGYISGLFVVAGLKLGLSWWVVRRFAAPIVSRVRNSYRSSLRDAK